MFCFPKAQGFGPVLYGNLMLFLGDEKMKRLTCFICTSIVAILLSACQQSPSTDVVISKNDGSFDANVVQSAEETRAADATESLSFSDTFSSTDGSVTFQIGIMDIIQTPNMPVIEVTPHFLTEEDARNAARALFGPTAVFYEAEPALNARYSKDEIITQIKRWSPYTSADGMKSLFPYGDESIWESDAQTLQEYITYLTSEFLDENSPDYVRPQCQWTFYKDSHYVYGAEEAEKKDTSQDNEQISAWTPAGDGLYNKFTVAKRNKEDFKLNNIYVSSPSGGPLLLDYEIYRAQKVRNNKPTQDQITAAVNKAQDIMDKMMLGTWQVELSQVEEYINGDATEYVIHVDAIPVLQGIPALHRPQLGNLKSKEKYASNYYLTEANFEFSADGTLMDFVLYSPLDIKQVVNENVKTLTKEELVNRAKEQLSLSDAYAYGAILDNLGTNCTCTVSITQFEYGLTRVKAPNTDESYYYIPAGMFLGNVEYCIQDTGETFYYRENIPLLMLNAVDGSVIPLANE